MTSLAAVIIDAFEFARTGRVLDGTISLVEFPRLLDMLERLGFPVVIHSRLQLRVGDVTEIAWSDEALDDDAYDIIPASQPLAVKDLVEDEVILLLPVSPMHDVCVLPKSGANDQKPSPFAVLAKLKKH